MSRRRAGNLSRPMQHRPEVIVLILQAVQPLDLFSSYHVWLCLLSKRHEVASVLPLQSPFFSVLSQPLDGVFSYGLQHPEARRSFGYSRVTLSDEALVEQCRYTLQNVYPEGSRKPSVRSR